MTIRWLVVLGALLSLAVVVVQDSGGGPSWSSIKTEAFDGTGDLDADPEWTTTGGGDGQDITQGSGIASCAGQPGDQECDRIRWETAQTATKQAVACQMINDGNDVTFGFRMQSDNTANAVNIDFNGGGAGLCDSTDWDTGWCGAVKDSTCTGGSYPTLTANDYWGIIFETNGGNVEARIYDLGTSAPGLPDTWAGTPCLLSGTEDISTAGDAIGFRMRDPNGGGDMEIDNCEAWEFN